MMFGYKIVKNLVDNGTNIFDLSTNEKNASECKYRQ